jgi:prevent-host-death family protein
MRVVQMGDRPMKRLNVSEVRRMLSRLTKEVAESGEAVLITQRGKAVAKLVPCSAMELGADEDSLPLRGLPIRISDDFDEPLDELWEAPEA